MLRLNRACIKLGSFAISAKLEQQHYCTQAAAVTVGRQKCASRVCLFDHKKHMKCQSSSHCKRDIDFGRMLHGDRAASSLHLSTCLFPYSTMCTHSSMMKIVSDEYCVSPPLQPGIREYLATKLRNKAYFLLPISAYKSAYLT